MNTPFASFLRTLLVALACAAAALPVAAAMQGRAAKAAAPATFDTCSWDRPGVDPFMGDVVAAVDRYQDIAPDVRERLKARMVRREYDDVVSIRRDSITGRAKVRYGSAIRDMHFGAAKVCHSVSRAAWNAQMQERGLVYCESGHCILVPTVCRNVSRIARAEVAHEHADGDVPELEAAPVAVLDLLPAPIPVDVASTPLSMAAAPEGAMSPDGSFASGSGAGSAMAHIASSGARGDSSTPQTSSPFRVDAAVTPVPEPETWGLMLAGLAALAAWRRRRR